MPVKLTEVQNMRSLVRSYKWDISFPTIPEMVTRAVGHNFSKDFNIRAISTSVPVARIEEVTAAPRGIDLHEPGLVHLDGQIQFTLVDTVDLISRKVLYALRQINMTDIEKVQQDIGIATSGSESQRFDILLARLDNFNNPIWYYLCCKCFIMSYTDPDFDGQSSAVQPQLTIQYNYFLDGEPDSSPTGFKTSLNSKLSEKLSNTGVTKDSVVGGTIFPIH